MGKIFEKEKQKCIITNVVGPTSVVIKSARFHLSGLVGPSYYATHYSFPNCRVVVIGALVQSGGIRPLSASFAKNVILLMSMTLLVPLCFYELMSESADVACR